MNNMLVTHPSTFLARARDPVRVRMLKVFLQLLLQLILQMARNIKIDGDNSSALNMILPFILHDYSVMNEPNLKA